MAFVKITAKPYNSGTDSRAYIVNTEQIACIFNEVPPLYTVCLSNNSLLYITPAEMEKIFAAIGQRL